MIVFLCYTIYIHLLFYMDIGEQPKAIVGSQVLERLKQQSFYWRGKQAPEGIDPTSDPFFFFLWDFT